MVDFYFPPDDAYVPQIRVHVRGFFLELLTVREDVTSRLLILLLGQTRFYRARKNTHKKTGSI